MKLHGSIILCIAAGLTGGTFQSDKTDLPVSTPSLLSSIRLQTVVGITVLADSAAILALPLLKRSRTGHTAPAYMFIHKQILNDLWTHLTAPVLV